jgi:2-oxoglutarate ferredoxin oxidoreductase subunit alpha
VERGSLITKVSKKLKHLEKYKRYKLTKSGVSPRPIPGTLNAINCSIGDEHDEEGYIVEDPVSRNKMMDKRERKIKGIKKELKNKSVSVHGAKKSNIVIVGWGSTKGIILEAVQDLNCKFVQVKTLHPFPSYELVKKIGKYKKLILIENNPNGQLGALIERNTDLEITHKYLKYDGRAFNPNDIINYVRRLK